MANEKESDRGTITVVMGRELATMVKTIATHKNITMAEAWEKYRPLIVEDCRSVLKEAQAALKVTAGG